MSNDSDFLMREVQEELRRDQLKRIWQDYGTYIVAGAALLLAGIGAFNWWQASRIAAAEAAGSQFHSALKLAIDEQKPAEAEKLLTSIAAGGTAGYATLAQLALAGEALEAGKTSDAAKAYDAAAERAPQDLLRDFARLQAAALKIDSADFTELQNRLKDLAAETSPWRYSARELMGLSALRSGKLPEARQALAPLSADLKVPASVRQRAEALMSLVAAAESARTAPQTVELEPAEGPPTQDAPAAPQATEGGAKAPSILDRLKGGGTPGGN